VPSQDRARRGASITERAVQRQLARAPGAPACCLASRRQGARLVRFRAHPEPLAGRETAVIIMPADGVAQARCLRTSGACQGSRAVHR
jgi:hypothetical protein